MTQPLPPQHHTEPSVPYAGIATRAVALVIDAAIVTASFWLFTAVLALVVSLFSDISLKGPGAAIGALGSWGFFVCAYFILCWTAGRTFGMHLMHLQVVTPRGKAPHFCASCIRMAAFVLGAIPLFAGYLVVLIHPRRRAFHDMAARTYVVYSGHEDELPRFVAAAEAGELAAADGDQSAAATTSPAPARPATR